MFQTIYKFRHQRGQDKHKTHIDIYEIPYVIDNIGPHIIHQICVHIVEQKPAC